MKKLAHEAIIEQALRKIEAGEWRPGDRLPTMPQLAREFGTSVTAVREALRVLETRGVVSIEHGRGIFLRHDPVLAADPAGKLRELTSSSLLQLLEARLVLEPELAAFCAERATTPQARQIHQLADRMAEEMRDGGDHFATDVAFHRTIAEAANNSLLAQMLEVVSDLSAKGRRDTDRLPRMSEKARHYHSLIAIAIEERQPEQARLLMKSHIQDMIAAVKQAWS